MPNGSALRLGAGRAASGPAHRRPLPSPTERLQRLSDRLDELLRDVSFRPVARSHHETEQRIHEAEAIAAELRAVFRSPTAEHPPLKRDGTGAWW
jgi:hypothetical protein